MEALILSAALDTNGQNARFVKAAARWGDDPSVTKAFAIGNADPAGVVTRYRLAAEKHGGLRIREAHKASAYFEFPTDILWNRRTEREVRLLAREADLIHLNNSDVAYRRLGLRKPALLHHHGSLFRSDPAHWSRVARQNRMVQAVSTLDLTKPDPRALHWLPTAYDLDELAQFGATHRRADDGRVRIVSCPTNRVLKATSELILAVRALQREGLPVDLVLIEERPWLESLEAKAGADIVFDQVAFGYGCNAVEAWGLGVPVVAGADGWTLERMRKEFGGGLPFHVAEAGSIADALRPLVQSADLRAEMAEAGKVHVGRYHGELPALARLADLYAKAIARYQSKVAVRLASCAPVTFRNTSNRAVYVEGERIVWTEGRYTSTSPLEVERIRQFVARRNYGITEETEATA